MPAMKCLRPVSIFNQILLVTFNGLLLYNFKFVDKARYWDLKSMGFLHPACLSVKTPPSSFPAEIQSSSHVRIRHCCEDCRYFIK